MNFKETIRTLLRKIGVESIGSRPWMEFNNLLKKYKISTVIDVGANIGQTAIDVSVFDKSIIVHSFEPVKSVFDELVENTTQYSNVYCYNVGLGASSEQASINVNKASPSSSLLDLGSIHKSNFAAATETHKETISITTLDTFFAETPMVHPILLKIDVQGFEKNVLEGGSRTLEVVDMIFIEAGFQELYKTQILFGDLFNMLTKAGFIFVGFVDLYFDSTTHDTLFGNAVFRKR